MRVDRPDRTYILEKHTLEVERKSVEPLNQPIGIVNQQHEPPILIRWDRWE